MQEANTAVTLWSEWDTETDLGKFFTVLSRSFSLQSFPVVFHRQKALHF